MFFIRHILLIFMCLVDEWAIYVVEYKHIISAIRTKDYLA